jgi:hydrogenase maturation protein HypF
MIARRSHRGIAKAFSSLGRRVAEKTGVQTIALSGGCFQNRLLLTMVAEDLGDFEICGPGPVPVNDGGLAFGQAMVALAQVD